MSTDKIIRRVVGCIDAPVPIGPYNQAILIDRTLYVSGMLGIDPETEELVDGGVVAEARQLFTNMRLVLEKAGSSLDRVVKTTVLLKNIDDFNKVNKIYKEFIPAIYPARSTYQVAKLPMDAQLEIEAIAVTGEVETSEPL